MAKQIAWSGQRFLAQKWVLPAACGGMCGLILGQAQLAGGIRPFALAWLAAVMLKDRGQGVAVFLGIGAGSWGLGYGGEMVAGLLAAAALVLVFWPAHFWQGKDWLIPVAVVALVNVFFKGLFYFLPMTYWYSWLAILAESVLAGAFVPAAQAALSAPRGIGQQAVEWTAAEKVGVLAVLTALFLGLNGWRLVGVDLQSVASRLAVMVAAYGYGSGGGAVMGLLAGLAPSLAGRLTTAGMGFYGLGGILAGLARPGGRAGVWCGFLAGNLLLLGYFATAQEMILTAVETLLAGVLFALLTARERQRVWVQPEQKLLVQEDKAQEKMNRLSRIFAGISEELSKDAPQDWAEKALGSLEGMYKRVYLQICVHCSRSEQCWGAEQGQLYQELSQACDLLEQKGRGEKCFSRWFCNRCKHTGELEVALLNQMDLIKQKKFHQEQAAQVKETVAKQLAGIGLIVDGLAKAEDYAKSSERAILQMSEREQLPLEKVRVFANEQRDWDVSLQFSHCLGGKVCQQQLSGKISKCLRRNYVLKQTVCSQSEGERCQLRLTPQKSYSICTAAAGVGKDGAAVSGDSWRVVELTCGKTAVILSDGMGVGTEASRQSLTTVNLLERLLSGGATHQLALEIVNAVLLLRSDGESFATVDLALIDAVSQRFELVKISAAPSFIKRQGMVKMFKSCSLPVGILEEVDLNKQDYPLAVNDLLIMMTDGVYDALADGQRWQEAIKNLPSDEPQLVCDYLLALAQSNDSAAADDMTVVAVKLEASKEE